MVGILADIVDNVSPKARTIQQSLRDIGTAGQQAGAQLDKVSNSGFAGFAAQAGTGAQTFAQRTAGLNAELNNLDRQTTTARTGLQTVGTATTAAAAPMLTLGDAARTAGALIGVHLGVQTIGQAVTAIGSMAVGWEQFTRIVSAAVPPFQDVTATQERLIATAKASGTELDTVGKLYQRLSLAGQELGISQERIFDATDTLSRGLAVFGASTSEANSAMLQLSQAFSKGRLDGDELKSLLENFPPLARALADEMGVAVGSLRDLGAEGKIGPEEMLGALERLREEVIAIQDEVGLTLPQAVNAAGVSMTVLVGRIDEAIGVSGAFAGAFQTIADVADDISQFLFPTLSGAIEDTREKIEALQKAAADPGGVDALQLSFGNTVPIVEQLNEAIAENDRLLTLQRVSASIAATGGTELATTFVEVSNRLKEIGEQLDDRSVFTLAAEQAGLAQTPIEQFNVELDKVKAELDEMSEAAGRSVSASVDLTNALGPAATNSAEMADQQRIMGQFLVQNVPLLQAEAKAVQESADAHQAAVIQYQESRASLSDISEAQRDAILEYQKARPAISDVTEALDANGLAALKAARDTEEFAEAQKESEEQLQASTDAVIEFIQQTENGGRAQALAEESARQAAAAIDLLGTESGQAAVSADQAATGYGLVSDVLDGVFARAAERAATSQRALKDVLEDTEFQEAAARVEQLDTAYDALDATLQGLFGALGGDLTTFVNNGINELQRLGINAQGVFVGMTESIRNFFDLSTEEFRGFASLGGRILDAFGIDLEDKIGKKATKVIQLLGSITQDEFAAIGKTFSGVVDGISKGVDFLSGLFTGGGAGGAGGGFVGTIGTAFQSIADTIGGLFGGGGGATGGGVGLPIGVGGGATVPGGTPAPGGPGVPTPVPAGPSFGAVAGNALGGAVTGFAGAQALGANKGGTIGAAVGGAAGAAVGTVVPVVGNIVGGLAGAAIGGVIGNAFGKDPEEFDEKKLSRDIFDSLVEGAIQARERIAAELNATGFDTQETLQRLELSFRKTSSAIDESLREAFQAEGLVVNLESAATSAAGSLSLAFGVSAVDISNILNSLPADVVGSFDAIGTNAADIAQRIAADFGLNADEVEAVLRNLAAAGTQALTEGLAGPADAVAFQLAEKFGVSVQTIQDSLSILPPAALATFGGILDNADIIARNLAPILGVPIADIEEALRNLGTTGEESLTLVTQTGIARFAELSQSVDGEVDRMLTKFGGLSVDAVDRLNRLGEEGDAIFGFMAASAVANIDEITAGFEGGGATAAQILQALSAAGINSFDQLGDNALGTLLEIVEGFGGTETEAQRILNILADNAGVAFVDILASAQAATGGTTEAFAAAAAQSIQFIEALQAQGINSFEDLGDNALQVLTEIVQGFGGTANDAAVFLNLLEANADLTFDQILAAALAATNGTADSFQTITNAAGASAAAVAQGFNAGFQSIAAAAGLAANSAAASLARVAASANEARKIVQNAKNDNAAAAGAVTFANGGITAFANGGGRIVNTPELFDASRTLLTSQLGLRGEAGPEAIMPLARTSSGALGVRVVGEGMSGPRQQIIINLDARGASADFLPRFERIVADLMAQGVAVNVEHTARAFRAAFA